MPNVLLTGASSGLGAAVARLLAADGDHVALAARRSSMLDEVVADIRADGGTAMALTVDVSDPLAVKSAVAEVEDRWGPVDTLVANAGIAQRLPARAFDASVVERIFRVNVLGLAHCVEAVLPSMLEAGRGHIVGVGSLAGYRGLPGSAPYGASKAAMRVLLEGLRVELGPAGIAVTHIAPGFVETPMTDRNDFDMPFLLSLDEGARHMYRAIRSRKAHYAFPWQLAAVVGAGRLFPPGLWDRILQRQMRS